MVTITDGAARVGSCTGSTGDAGRAGGGDVPAATGGGIVEVSTQEPQNLDHLCCCPARQECSPSKPCCLPGSLANQNFPSQRRQKIPKEEEM